ncbi:hypothetical protein RV11_GL003468 [Enterococcus phoeniculicola]|uniref:Uncharacterized protein n=1 Tax=Enterococcus phoeniculicola ATCC BAA-412 TaxID=1158610 RepID=R3WJI9_9ENTE|nr:hypothetical protein [Enterococcus phoeniculicola]EOL42040.1 hypothetical protein UC3_02388 [Enterococcus phoeniculicola ATCC BAA-412]EOT79681.1 hypothetical protein I589_01193 [Enterococcus phoeniculicola ATCC BAA-412]OJG71747.1 hypothetical protein RV11_GL003468 [Enterococcus phoeniculicola]
MQFKEFQEWLETNSTSKEVFLSKWSESQAEKNKKRQPKKRWDEKKVLRSGTEEWKRAVTGAYEKIKAQKGVPKFNGYQIWTDFIDEIGFVEMFDDSINELEFE